MTKGSGFSQKKHLAKMIYYTDMSRSTVNFYLVCRQWKKHLAWTPEPFLALPESCEFGEVGLPESQCPQIKKSVVLNHVLGCSIIIKLDFLISFP